jgi:quinone-modifying oxidoreductase subunit QmoC
MKAIQRELRFESDRDLGFADAIRKMPGCEAIDRCIQCATCSGICPVSTYMDFTPRRVIELTRSGFKADVLHSNTIWICASCYACQVECPKEIGIADIMVALKTRAIEEGAYPRGLPIPILAQEFHRMVSRTGRVTESGLVQRLYLRTNPLKLVGLLGLGWKLLRTGRMSLKADSMKRPESLRKVLQAVSGATR